MIKIKFSHRYSKMPPGFEESILLDVLSVKLEDLSPGFREWDTAICGGGNYPLPDSGEYMLLMLLSSTGRLWTTIRRWNPFRPAFHEDKLQQINWKRDRPSKIFLNSMGDWFSEDVDPSWIAQILEAISLNDRDTFFVLIKRPDRIPQMIRSRVPENLWIGVSVTHQGELWKMRALQFVLPDSKKFVSFEPLQGDIWFESNWPFLNDICWVIIGAETGNRKGKISPERRWIEIIAHIASALKIPVFLKDNLSEIMGDPHLRQEFPEAMP